MNIREAVRDEYELQERLGFCLTERAYQEVPPELLTSEEHEPVYLPPYQDTYLAHAVIARNEAEFAELFDEVGLVLGRPIGQALIDRTVEHEARHAEAAVFMGQTSVRYGAWLRFGTRPTVGGDIGRTVSIDPVFLCEDVHMSRVGMGIMLAAPTDPSAGDRQQLRALRFDGVSDVYRRADEYNGRRGTTVYPLLPRVPTH